jgi:hypothetical protein
MFSSTTTRSVQPFLASYGYDDEWVSEQLTFSRLLHGYGRLSANRSANVVRRTALRKATGFCRHQSIYSTLSRLTDSRENAPPKRRAKRPAHLANTFRRS